MRFSLNASLQGYNGQTISNNLAVAKKDTAAEKRFRKDLDIHTALLFYSSAHNAHKVDTFKTADHHELIQETLDSYIVWQSDEQRQDTLEKVFSGVDPKTKMQICATYDPGDKDLVFHYGGTDFNDRYDVIYGMIAGMGWA